MADANIRAVITAEDKASATLTGFSKNIDKVGDSAAQLVKRIAQIGTVAAGAVAALGVKTAADLESARQGFITLLGSAEAADSTLVRIKKEAARTPFEIVGLTQATQLLSSVTKNGDRALDFILDIGEGLAAMGRGQAELDRISVNLQQIAATGRAASIDIKQFAFAGIPIYEMLQKETGLAGQALEEFTQQGGVTFDLLEKMFQSATSEGGRFFGAYKNQLGTFNQQWSNLKDTFATTAADIVVQTGLFTKLKDVMGIFGSWIAANKDFIIGFFNFIGTVATGFINGLKLAWESLKEPLETLWNVISTQLAPSIKNLLIELQPLAPLIGGVLLIGLRLFIEVLTILARIIAIVAKNITDYILVVKDMWNSTKNAFAAVWDGVKKFIEPIANVFNSIVDSINTVIRKMGELKNAVANNPVSKAIGAGTNFLGGLLPGRAAGGPVGANQAYLVGEKGPELFVPSNNGRIIPNNQTPSGGQTIVNVTANIGVYAGTEIEKRKLAKELFESLKDVAGSKNMSVSQMLGG